MKKLGRKIKKNKGMTYVELIVVLSIFSVVSSIVMFNYGDFQAKVDIKNLASDIALKIVEAQKSSLAGLLPPPSQQSLIISGWKPSYGLYFNRIVDPASFIYFADVNNDYIYAGSDACSSDCLSLSSITKGNHISNLDVIYQDSSTAPLNDLTITFVRPDSSAIIRSSQIVPPLASPISYVQMTVASPGGIMAVIKLYPSGRVQVN
ncbi:MAG: type II secretion system protein [Candidatus Omnitrophica bacterium]|nr:type II secretion system protein [Candidatus Omnitrophota bacterium]